MSESPFIVEATAENFRQVVLENSLRVPVLVDFWAQWCQPCKALMPLLSKLAEDYGGRFILAKVNTEEQRALASQFGIRSIPTVKLFKGGQPVDEFAGALPEDQIRAFLDKHIPRQSDAYVAQARQLLMHGQAEQALEVLRALQEQDPDNPNIPINIAQTLGAMGDLSGALAVLDALPADAQKKPEVAQLRNHLFFEAKAASLPDPQALAARIQANAKDAEAHYQLAFFQVIEQDYEGAMQSLLQVMRIDRTFENGAAKDALFKIFEILGQDPLAAKYRSKMMSLIY